ncbi:putative membrane protein, partial [Cucurbita argyrosperma subsp. argyrosperma]
MGSRIPSHQLSGGLYVSGRPEQLKERPPTMGSRAVPYTGGDVKKSGELGKMFDLHLVDSPTSGHPPSKSSRPSSSSQHNSGSVRSGPNSGPVTKHSNSGPISKKSSGPISLPPTGLITSGPLGSGPLGSSSSGGGGGGRRSGPLEQTTSFGKTMYGAAVTSLSEDVKLGFKVSKVVVWAFLVVLVTGLLVGAFLMVAVKKPIILVAAGGLLVPAVIAILWNIAWGKRGLIGFVRRYPDAELRGAIDGQYVKVTGVVTCGSIPLESSYQRVPRCVYRYVADFYISDFQTGLRALVKAGYGAKVAPFVKPSTVVDVTNENRDLSPSFLGWLADHKLSSDDRVMRLKEGYIKEGSTVSVMGVVQRQDNVLMVVPSTEPVSTGCQWARCLLPTYVEGLIITCDDNQNADVVPV